MPRLGRFASMAVVKLVELRGQLDEHLAKRREDLEREISLLKTHVPGIRQNIRGDTLKGVTTRRNTLKGVKVPPKYRGPKGETWAGRGVHPTWLVALLKRGHKLDEFAIAKPAVAAAKKVEKVAGKPARKRAKRKATRKASRGGSHGLGNRRAPTSPPILLVRQ